MKKVIKIEGMMCEHCAGAVKTALLNTEGTKSVKICLKKGTATIETETTDDAIKAAVEAAGYKVIGE